MRNISEPRKQGGALEHHGAGIAIGEALDARVLLPESDATRQQHDGRGEVHAAESQPQGTVDIGDARVHAGHYGL